MFDRDPIENQYYQIRLRPGHMTHDRSSNWKLHPAEVKRGHWMSFGNASRSNRLLCALAEIRPGELFS